MLGYRDSFDDVYVEDDYIIDGRIEVYNPNDSIYIKESSGYLSILNTSIKIEKDVLDMWYVDLFSSFGLSFDYSEKESLKRDYFVDKFFRSGEDFYSYTAISDIETVSREKLTYFIEAGFGLRAEKIWFDRLGGFFYVNIISFNHERFDLFQSYVSGGFSVAF